ncbi:MAG TPA: transaldolase [Anaerolineae bacterium]|nr:transaldolase [Anaerolineae bacterium]
MKPLVALHEYGQSAWLDYIRRDMLENGELAKMIGEDGLRGMTSNPSIFQKAIGESDDYDEALAELVAEGAETNEIYEALAIADIQQACDAFASLYEEADGGDGLVSLEVSPDLANDTEGTIAEAKRLWATVNRPNLMIKVPATEAGIPAIRTLIGEGININVTLMFNMAHYEAVASAYIEGLEALVAGGGDPRRVASVASFFVSRVDAAVDEALEKLGNEKLQGKIAIANSKVVYQRFKVLFHGERFAELKAAGAQPQRLLWASTSTKNPDYPDTLYVDALIGPETVNTLPPKTLEAFKDHGTLAATLEKETAEAAAALAELDALGIDLTEITEELQTAGVKSFADSFTQLMATIDAEQKRLAAAV